jgi:hypothetical protein
MKSRAMTRPVDRRWNKRRSRSTSAARRAAAAEARLPVSRACQIRPRSGMSVSSKDECEADGVRSQFQPPSSHWVSMSRSARVSQRSPRRRRRIQPRLATRVPTGPRSGVRRGTRKARRLRRVLQSPGNGWRTSRVAQALTRAAAGECVRHLPGDDSGERLPASHVSSRIVG